MKYASKRPVTPAGIGGPYRTRYPRALRDARAGALWRLVSVVVLGCALVGCGTTLESASCSELAEAAAGNRCPERVIEKPIPQPARFDLEDPPDPPPITSADLEDDTPILDVFRALAEDLKAARQWGHELYAKYSNVKRANDALKPGGNDHE